jgi:Methyltransferase domain
MSFSPAWLALREPADAAARAAELVDALPLPTGPLVIHDLGCGTGSMARWLAPRLPGPQHWVLHDRDPDLLAHAAATLPAGVTAETVPGDLAGLTAADLSGASLVTTSALLDLLTAAEVQRLAAACAGLPALLTLSVTGRVELDPGNPLDAAVEAAFNDHQRRGGRLGPDAAAAATDAFERLGAVVHVRSSPWRLGPDNAAALTAEWLRGWVGAAREQRPGLDTEAYLARRLAHLPAAVVQHTDLLALPE